MIYVLEDDDGIRGLFQVILEDHGYEVELFPCVETFKQGILNAVPDLVIMDIWLSDGDGRAVCKELRKQVSTAEIPILMMTAQFGVGKIEGASDFISKPFDVSDLIDRVEKLLSVQI